MATFYTKWLISGKSEPNSETYTVGGVKVTYSMDVRHRYVVSESVNEKNNTSTFTVKKYAVFYYTWDTPISPLNNVISRSRMPNSGGYSSDTGSLNPVGSPTSWTLIGTDTFTIEHDVEGGGKVTFGGLGTHTGGSGTVYQQTVSATITMTKINRASTITSNATGTTEFGDEITFSITRKSSGFTHDLTYQIYNQTGTIATGVGTSYNWTIPTSLINYSPSNAKPSILITCTTKNGNTIIGTNTYNLVVNVPSAYIPSCSLEIFDKGVVSQGGTVPDEWEVFVQGKSLIQGIITAEGISGSYIKSYISTANSQVLTNNPFVTEPLKSNGEQTITSTAYDSRGRSNSDTEEIIVVEYFSPTIINCKVERCSSDGTLDTMGTYGKATIKYIIAPINDGTQDLNTKSVKLIYGEEEFEEELSNYEGEFTFPTLLEGLENDTSYNINFQLIDSFDAIPQPYTLSPSFVTMSKKAGGHGVTFGQIATEDGVIFHMDTKAYGDNWLKKISVDGLVIEKIGENNWIIYGGESDD